VNLVVNPMRTIGRRLSAAVDRIFLAAEWRRLPATERQTLLDIAALIEPQPWDHRRTDYHELFGRGLMTNKNDLAELTSFGRDVAAYGQTQVV
jgi:hypothetical protein